MSESLFCYFKPLNKKEGEEQIDIVEAILPHPNGSLSQEVPPPATAEANKEAQKITKYAIKNGNCSATRKFGKSLEKLLNESTVCYWVAIYKKELERRRKTGETVPDVSVLLQSKQGRPLLIPGKLDYKSELT